VIGPTERGSMSFEEALQASTRDEGFKATIYAMNSLLIQKGIYTQEEFQQLFIEWVEKEQRKRASASSVHTDRLISV
jgi:uncharacterized protein YprB with RNaseH-like and TPR domain